VAQEGVGPENARAEELAQEHLGEGKEHHDRQEKDQEAALQPDEKGLSFS
jgi:hypothetical protein